MTQVSVGHPITTAYVVDAASGEFKQLGVAICALGDRFCKATGRKLALARALQDMPRTDRTLVWQAYHKFCTR